MNPTHNMTVEQTRFVNRLLQEANGGENEGPVARYMREKKVRKAAKRIRK